MATRRCIQLFIYFLATCSSLADSVSSPVSITLFFICLFCFLLILPNDFFLLFQVPVNKFLMQSYYDRYTILHDSDFDNFMSQAIPSGSSCGFVLRLSDLKRTLIGEGSHRSVSTLIKFQTQQLKCELLSYSCEFIIIERLPSGVFADPFELQHLVHRGSKYSSPSPAFHIYRRSKKNIHIFNFFK